MSRYDERKLDFLTAPEVLVRLTYDSRGLPIAMCAGKIRERAKDQELMLTWLRKLRDQITEQDSSRE